VETAAVRMRIAAIFEKEEQSWSMQQSDTLRISGIVTR